MVLLLVDGRWGEYSDNFFADPIKNVTSVWPISGKGTSTYCILVRTVCGVQVFL